MANTFTSNVFSSTYKDDFVDSDNYHRILFNSGRALQARELTQLQTIIQEEIGRFGRNIFKDGASVNPGGPTITNNYEFIKLNTAVNTLPATPSDLVGVELTGGTSTVKARVLEVVESISGDPATIYVQYTNTSGGAVGANPVRFIAGEDLTGGGETLTVQTTNTVANPAFGRGAKIANGAGDFFTRGHFVFAPAQELILSKYSQNPTAVIGFKVTEDIVTTSDTAELYDNQGSTPNLSSPGADRYRIKLTLTTQDLVDSDENFIFFCNVVDGEIVDQVTGTDDYNKINELLAERTKEESGNYIAESFEADLSDSGDNLIITVSNGVAYVNGYRAETETPTKLIVSKPRSTVTNTNEVVGINYGQYFICDVLKGSLNVSEFESLNLRSAVTHGGSTIGTAKVRYVEEDGANFRVYLFDIKMNSGQVLRNVKSVGTSTTDYADILLENSKAVIKESTKVNMVFATPNPRPKNIYDVDFEVQRISTGTSNGSGSLTLSLSATEEKFVNTGQWIVTDSSGDVVASPSFSVVGDRTSVTITGLPNSQGITVYSKVNKGQPSVRQKTLIETTFSGAVESDGSGTKYVDLHATDIYDVLSIKQTDSDGSDLSSRFTVDNGQRAGYYANGRLVLDGGATTPSGSVFTRFKHFIHGAGDYFSVNSYTGQVNYENIPDFQVGPRTSVNLRDVIDFRSSVDSDGTFTGSGAALNEVPTNGDVFQGDIEYYMPRADKIVVTTQGVVKNIQGENGFASQIPSTPENTLSLFELEHNAYGLNDSDTVVTPVESKRFTMRDISNLEKRIDKLEEVTSLSLLEVDTSALLVLDSAGNPRTKSGFFVDNFADRSFSDAQNSEYRAAIDPSRGILQPQTVEENVTLRYDSAASSNTILKGDTVFLNYTHKEAITQAKVSGVENVNPFAVITGEGNITLSPASDEWQQTKYSPTNIINKTASEQLSDINEGQLALGTARQRGFNQWAWSGVPFIPLNGFGIFGGLNLFGGWAGTGLWNWGGVLTNNDITLNNTRRSGRNITRQYSQRIVVGNRTVRKLTGDRTVSLTFLPYIRSRKVFFRAEGMRPNTKYFPFFDNIAVDDFVREESFDRFSSSANGGATYGNAYRNSTSHPEGSSELVSNNNGKIAGSFFIPSNTSTRFRAGTREFKLLDISKNDDNASLSRASINYVAQGTLDTRQKTVTSTRINQVRTRRWTETQQVRNRDPLAQSFRVTEPSGMFVTKVQTYFKTRDDVIPIELQIRPMVNGSPSATEIIGNAIKFLNTPSSEVNLPASQTAAGVIAAPTTFEFDEPIFLNPNTEYAIVLLAESTNYEAYVGETYAFELGSTEKRINRQPSMGSLFKSQNGTTWEPDQTKDLAFKLFKAEFDTVGGYAVFENVDLEDEALENNPLYVNSGDATVTMSFPNHGYSVGDTINITGLDSATRYNGILGSSIMNPTAPNGLVTAVDGFGLRFEADSASTSAGRFGGTSIITDRQVQFDLCVPNFTTLIPDDTNLSYSAKFTTGKSLAAITGQQVRYQKDASYSSDIIIGDENVFSAPRLVANSSNETLPAGLDGLRSTTFKVDMTTTRADVSPIIDAQRASLTTIGNMIDNQATSPASGFNVPLNYTEETTAFGGSALSKHMSTVSVLEEAAVGLKVIVSAIRPSGSDFDLYFRTANDGEDIFDIDWTLQSSETTVAPDGNNFREYRYLIGGQGGDVAEFTQYQYKIVMRSNNSSAIPVFKDFRSIAMAV
jgi:hypothetical protein